MKHNPLRWWLLLTIGSFIILFSFCDSSESYSASFSQDIMPIFSNKCHQCHLSESGSFGNLNLSSYESLMSGNSNHGIDLVFPGSADQSLLYESVATDEQTVLPWRMPQGGPYLSAVQIQLIEDWINEGAKDN